MSTEPVPGREDGTDLLEVCDLRVSFPTDHGELSAVRGLSYRVEPGEVVAMVGESGSGKSAAAMAVIGLLPEYATVSGSVRLAGQELLGRSDTELSAIRGARIGTVFQDPMSALTPVYTVGDQIAEAITIHHEDVGKLVGKKQARRRAVELLELEKSNIRVASYW
ncbi:MAG TPA: ATP-binding cassette domain-containing protein, partial [Mycobacterium sp.]|nr:ATP-binding cassette domain-containing protein [Mycobacterium sp.]